ncbi:MAG: TlpA family protein disulfide reductase [Bacteroidetes bacterium]|nr:TlpA family protein disulfide reductase [Bacteroidota bacterium]
MLRKFSLISLLLIYYVFLAAQPDTRNFSAYDREGKKVSLSDFKGKVVLVDVWATWCAPCKAEIPYLKELEKAYHDKEVVVMSISIDPATDKPKWTNFIKKENLTGVQLFGGDGPKSEIVRLHGINAIPRFLLYNKKGELVNANAPRPSDPALRSSIDQLLH